MASSSAPLDVDPFFLLHRGDDIHRLGRSHVDTNDNVGGGGNYVASDYDDGDGEHEPPPEATFQLPTFQLLTEDGVQPYIWATAPSIGINVDSRYQLLYTAAMRGDWGSAQKFIREDDSLLIARISIFSWTALHIASGQGHGKFVEQLVSYMTEEAVALRDLGGYTALHYAAKAGSLRCVQAIHRKNPILTQIVSNSGHVPLHIAAGSSTTPGQKEVVWYLCKVTEYEGPDGPFASPRGFELMWGIIAAEYLDIAMFLIRKYPYLAAPCPEREYDYYVLDMLGQMPFVFKSQSRLGFWEGLISYFVPVKLEDMSPDAHMHDAELHDGDAMPFFSKSRIYVKRALKLIRVPALKRIYEEKSKHKYAMELLNEVFSQAGELNNSEKLHLLTYYNILANAAAKGITEILRECFEFFPDAVWFTTNYESLLQTCIKYRQEKVFNLLQEITAQNKLMADRIVLGDTTLHLVAKMAPFDKLKAVSGSALQMQSEIQWFKAVEKLLRPVYLSYRNHENIAAHELFTKEHEKLLESGEKWMKDTSSSCMVVATLIATVVFAAAFTVPGGNNQDTGIPIFLSKTSFLVFAISDAVALFSSTASILMFLSILTSRFAEQDFLDALPRRLIIGLASLFFAIVTMLIAFGAALSVVLVHRFSWIAFPVTLLACLPVGLFAKLQLPLFYQMVKSTFRSSISSHQGNLYK